MREISGPSTQICSFLIPPSRQKVPITAGTKAHKRKHQKVVMIISLFSLQQDYILNLSSDSQNFRTCFFDPRLLKDKRKSRRERKVLLLWLNPVLLPREDLIVKLLTCIQRTTSILITTRITHVFIQEDLSEPVCPTYRLFEALLSRVILLYEFACKNYCLSGCLIKIKM